jgi:hypothetical protein
MTTANQRARKKRRHFLARTFNTGQIDVVVMCTVVYTQPTVLTLIQVSFLAGTLDITEPNGTLTRLSVRHSARPLDHICSATEHILCIVIHHRLTHPFLAEVRGPTRWQTNELCFYSISVEVLRTLVTSRGTLPKKLVETYIVGIDSFLRKNIRILFTAA